MPINPDKHDISSSLDKGLTLLIELLNNEEEMGITDLKNKTGLPVSTISRVITTLVRRGFVIQNPTNKKYALGFIMQSFADSNSPKNILKNISQPILNELRDRTNETALIYVRAGVHRELIYFVESLEELRTSPSSRLVPLYAGSASRVLWSFSSDDEILKLFSKIELTKITSKTICDKAELLRQAAIVRAKGYAVSLGERNQGVGGISAPVFDSKGKVIAAVSVSMPLLRFDDKTEERTSPLVLWAAKEISRQLNDQVTRPIE